MGSFSATLETRPLVTTPSIIGELGAVATGAAVATIPVLLGAIHIGLRSFGGGGLSPDAPLSVIAAQIVLATAPMLLVTVAVAVSLAARPLGLRTCTAAPVRRVPTRIVLAAWAIAILSVLAAPRVFALAFYMLAMSPLFTVLLVYAQPAISIGIWASAVIVGVSVAASLAMTQRKNEQREAYSPNSMVGVLLVLPCIALPILMLWFVPLQPTQAQPANWTPVLATPLVSMTLFGAAFVSARRRRSADAFSTLGLAGRSMVVCATELSFIGMLLGQANLMC